MTDRFNIKFQNFTYVSLQSAKKEETEKDIVLDAYRDLMRSGMKLTAAQKVEVAKFVSKYRDQ
jgi:hypothetical protein